MKIVKGVMNVVEKGTDFIRNNAMRSTDRVDGKIVAAKTSRVGVMVLIAILVVMFIYGVIRNSQEESPINNFKSEIKTQFGSSQGVGTPNFNKSELEGYKANLDMMTTGLKPNDSIPLPDSMNGLSGKAPNKFECNELLQGLKNGDNLNESQKVDLTKCMDSNVLPMSEDQKTALRQALNDSTLTPEARKLLAAYAENPSSLSEDDRKLVKGLMSSDPEVKSLAMGALESGLSDEEKKKALSALDDALQGDKSGIKDVADIVEKGKVLAQDASKKWSLPTFGLSGSESKSDKNDSPSLSSSPKYAGAKTLDKEISDNDEKINRNSSAIKQLSDKIKKELSKPEEVREPLESAYSQMATLSKEQTELKKANQVKKLQLDQMATEMNNDLAVIKSGMRTRNSSAIGIFEDVPELNNSEIVNLSEDELRLLKLLEDGDDRFNKKRKNMAMDGKGGENSKLIVGQFFNTGDVQINPAVRLLADLDDDIWVSEKNFTEYTVIGRLRQDAVEIGTGKVVLYSGSMIFGKISSINSGVDTCTVVFDRAQVGAKIVKIKISTQIKGVIKETRGAEITASLITELASSIADGIKEQGENELSSIANPTMVDRVNNATTGALGSGFNKIAQLIAGDLQNSSRIYFAKKGTKLVLNP